MPPNPLLEQGLSRHSTGVCPTEQVRAPGPDGGADVSTLGTFASDGSPNCLKESDSATPCSEGSREHGVESVSIHGLVDNQEDANLRASRLPPQSILQKGDCPPAKLCLITSQVIRPRLSRAQELAMSLEAWV